MCLESRLSPDSRDEKDAGAAADAALRAAITSLAARTRELVEAVVLSEAAIADLRAAGAEIANLAAQLGPRRRPAPIRPAAGPADRWRRQRRNPVTGEANPLAPPISIVTTPAGTARAEFVLGPGYEGPPGAVHGGVCAAILDSLLGSAAAAGNRPGMTARLTLTYLRPTPLGAPLVAEAWIRGVERRTTIVDGRIRNERGELTVEASGEFSLPLRWQRQERRDTGPHGGRPG